MNMRVYNTVISSQPATRHSPRRRGPEREIVLHSTTLSLSIDFVKLWKIMRQFLFVLIRRNANIESNCANECSRILEKQAARWVIVTELRKIKTLLLRILHLAIISYFTFFVRELGRQSC